MSTETWPLSAAATQLLIDLREDGSPRTPAQTISRLAVKELVMRGDLRVVSMKKRMFRKVEVRVATNPSGPRSPIPAPLDLLVRHLPITQNEDLAKVIKKARQGSPSLFTSGLKDAALADLVHRGLAEHRQKKVMGFWPSSFVGPTPAGREWAARARQNTGGVITLPALAEQDLTAAVRTAAALGAILLLAPGGLSIAIKLSRRWRERASRGIDAALTLDDIGWLDSIDDTLGSLLDSISSGDFDGAFDSIADAVDAGIDSGVSDGGGDGSSSGGDGGGGGCGGGGD